MICSTNIHLILSRLTVKFSNIRVTLFLSVGWQRHVIDSNNLHLDLSFRLYNICTLSPSMTPKRVETNKFQSMTKLTSSNFFTICLDRLLSPRTGYSINIKFLTLNSTLNLILFILTWLVFKGRWKKISANSLVCLLFF